MSIQQVFQVSSEFPKDEYIIFLNSFQFSDLNIVFSETTYSFLDICLFV
jgi:hypothetical protein